MTLRFNRLGALVLALAALGYAACGGDDNNNSRIAGCTPGESNQCACLDGRSGTQTCNVEGTFDSCICPPGGSGGATASGGTATTSGGFSNGGFSNGGFSNGGFGNQNTSSGGTSPDQNFTSCLADFCPPSNQGMPCCLNPSGPCGVNYSGYCEQRRWNDVFDYSTVSSGGANTGGSGGGGSGSGGSDSGVEPTDSGTAGDSGAPTSDSGTQDGTAPMDAASD